MSIFTALYDEQVLVTVRRSEWNRSKLHGSSVRGLIISNIPYCDDAAIEESQLGCAVWRE